MCLVYVFRGVPLERMVATLKLYPTLPIFLVVGVSFVSYAIMGARLSLMSSPRLSFSSCFCATLAGLAINNILPAKAGEVAKALWLGRANGLPFQKTLGVVFMERFFDVNVLAFLSLWSLWNGGEKKIVFVFAACITAGWCVLAFFKLHPFCAERFVSLFGREKFGTESLERFVSQALGGVLDNMSRGRLARLGVMSLVIWCFYATQMIFSLNSVAGLGLSLGDAVTVFAVSSLGMLLPSSPGAIGVYEAFAVTILKSYGVKPESALTVALFSHAAQFIPVTLVGGVVCAFFPHQNKSNSCPTGYP
ncbi:hypothetical protein AGMMS50276_09990 [Synergistales bacterium]|nr:hypothetical protein AGMMS50276_09990 [Synergistales bacterium]